MISTLHAEPVAKLPLIAIVFPLSFQDIIAQVNKKVVNYKLKLLLGELRIIAMTASLFKHNWKFSYIIMESLVYGEGRDRTVDRLTASQTIYQSIGCAPPFDSSNKRPFVRIAYT